MKIAGPFPIEGSRPPQWIARASPKGGELAAAVAALEAAAPAGARLFRLVAMRAVGKGQRYAMKALYERIPQPGDPPELAPIGSRAGSDDRRRPK